MKQAPEVKIRVIYENRADDCYLQEGWGFSLFIEHEDRKILFDTGGYPAAFFSNIEKMNIRLEDVTHVVFSHRHWDHMAGFEEVLAGLREKTKVYLPKFFRSCFRGALFKKIPSKLDLHTVKEFAEIDTNLYSIVLKAGFFLYEQSIILNTSQGAIILTGCSHPGIVNIVKAVREKLPGKIQLVMGGFHLLFQPANLTAQVVKDFQELDVKMVAPCHCSGDHTIRQFKEAYQDNFIKIGTGTILSL